MAILLLVQKLLAVLYAGKLSNNPVHIQIDRYAADREETRWSEVDYTLH